MDFRETSIGPTGFGWLRIWCPVAGFCEHGNEPSGSIKKALYFFDKLSNYQVFK
jgi:hypothetical protein